MMHCIGAFWTLLLTTIVAGADAAARREGRLLPIFFMHGLNGWAGYFDPMQSWIRQIDPTVEMYSFPLYEHMESLTDLWTQGEALMEGIRAKVAASPEIYKNGYTLICHSQGALLCRSVVQRMDDHNIHTFIALAGPQMGEFGLPADWGKVIPWARDQVFLVAYTSTAQDRLSLANLWHDPRPRTGFAFHPQRDYWAGNTFLPVFNNDPNRMTQGSKKPKDPAEGNRYKRNFLRLKNSIFTCGPADDQIKPYDSGIWNFYGEEISAGTVPLEQSQMWADDWIGLRTLGETQRLVRITLEDVCHDCWAQNETVFMDHVAQYLPFQSRRLAEEVLI